MVGLDGKDAVPAGPPCHECSGSGGVGGADAARGQDILLGGLSARRDAGRYIVVERKEKEEEVALRLFGREEMAALRRPFGFLGCPSGGHWPHCGFACPLQLLRPNGVEHGVACVVARGHCCRRVVCSGGCSCMAGWTNLLQHHLSSRHSVGIALTLCPVPPDD